MKKRCCLLLSALLGCTLLPTTAIADEVWSTNQSDVVYQEDRGNTAIWTYGDENTEDSSTIFIDGLAGVTTDRGSYSGYWAQQTSSLRCDTFREGIDGEPTYHWGRFEITFIDPDFPSRWQAKFGLCDPSELGEANREPKIRIDAEPITR